MKGVTEYKLVVFIDKNTNANQKKLETEILKMIERNNQLKDIKLVHLSKS